MATDTSCRRKLIGHYTTIPEAPYDDIYNRWTVYAVPLQIAGNINGLARWINNRYRENNTDAMS
jgi:hypothetical protein